MNESSKIETSQRLKEVNSGAIRNAFKTADQSQDPINLSIGFPEEATPDNIKTSAIEAIQDNQTYYAPANGYKELRQAITKKLRQFNKIEASEDEVTIVPGATNGILMSYMAILNPGDEVIIADPYFPPFKSLANMLGAKAVPVSTYPDFRFNAEKIRPYVNEKTKLLVVNSPNNPSGAIYTKEEIEGIVELAKENDLIILSDEVYEYFAHEREPFSISTIYPKTITLNSFSKSYSMTGWRVGYIHAPEEVIEGINELLQYTIFSTSSISQLAALEAVKNHPDTSIYKEKKERAENKLSAQIEVKGLEGAFFAFVPVPEGLTDIDFTELAMQNGIIILPGSVFSEANTHVRISYGGSIEEVDKGMEKLCHLLAKHQ